MILLYKQKLYFSCSCKEISLQRKSQIYISFAKSTLQNSIETTAIIIICNNKEFIKRNNRTTGLLVLCVQFSVKFQKCRNSYCSQFIRY